MISGLGGVGKSAVARELCRQARARLLYPSGIFWVDADSHMSLDTSFRRIAIAPPVSAPEKLSSSQVREVVLGWLASHPGWLLIVDNADDPSLAKPYIPAGASRLAGHVVLTTRANKSKLVDAGVLGSGQRVWQLDVLQPRDALSMLESVRSEAQVDATAALRRLEASGPQEVEDAQWLVGPDALHGLALAVQQAGSYMRVQRISYTRYAQLYREMNVALFGERRVGSDPWSAVEAWLVRQQLEECGSCLRAAGYTSMARVQSLTEEDLPSLGLPTLYHVNAFRAALRRGVEDAARRSVRTTWELSLVQLTRECEPGVAPVGKAAVDTLRLLSLVAPDHIPVEVVARAGLFTTAPHDLRAYIAGPSAELGPPSGGDVQPVDTLVLQRAGEVVDALSRYSLVALEGGSTRDLRCFRVHRLLQAVVREDQVKPAPTAQALVDVCCASLRDGVSQAWASRHTTWATAVVAVGVWGAHAVYAAHVDVVMQHGRGTPPLPSFVGLMEKATSGLLGVGDTHSAIIASTLAMECSKQLHGGADHPEVATCMEGHACVLIKSHRPRDAIAILQAVVLMRHRLRMGTPVLADVSASSTSASGASGASGVPPASVACTPVSSPGTVGDHFHDVLAVAAAAAHHVVVPTTGSEPRCDPGASAASLLRSLSNLVAAHHDAGELKQALALLSECEPLLQHVMAEDQGLIAHCASNLAQVYQSVGFLPQALHLARYSLQEVEARSRGVYTREWAAEVNNVSQLMCELGDVSGALDYARLALVMERELWGKRDHDSVVRALANLAFVLESSGQLPEAELRAKESLDMMQRMQPDCPSAARAKVLNTLSLVHQQTGSLELALDEAVEAVCIARAQVGPMTDHPDLVGCARNLASLLKNVGRFEPALDLAVATWHMECRLRCVDTELAVDLLNTIGTLCFRLMRLSDAWRWTTDAVAMARRLGSTKFMELCSGNDQVMADMVAFSPGFCAQCRIQCNLGRCWLCRQVARGLEPSPTKITLTWECRVCPLWNSEDEAVCRWCATPRLASASRLGGFVLPFAIPDVVYAPLSDGAEAFVVKDARLVPRVRGHPPSPRGATATTTVTAGGASQDRKRPAPATGGSLATSTGAPTGSTNVCHRCHREYSGQGGACSRCKRVRYCSVKCQKEDWTTGHREQCAPPRANGPGL